MKKAKFGIIIALLAAIALALWFFLSHTFVGGGVYPKNADVLDLLDKSITLEQYEAIQAEFPESEIHWNVPFQGSAISSQSTELTLSGLTEADMDSLVYFPKLEKINAAGCENYGLLTQLQEMYPGLAVHYTVTIDGTAYPESATELTVTSISDTEVELLQYLPLLDSIDATGCSDLPQLLKIRQQYPNCDLSYIVPVAGTTVPADSKHLILSTADARELLEVMPHFTRLETVSIATPVADGEALTTLWETYPSVKFHWEMDVLGMHITTEEPELDFSGAEIPSVEAVESALACFPNLEKVYLGECGLDNDELAAYRDRAREDYKVAWLLRIGIMPVRTDDISFMPGKPSNRYYVDDKDAELLRYCEDMICVDVGHYLIYHCDWAAYMPKLKYLILADTPVKDISPIVNLKELEYLELCSSHVTDFSPLVQCTSLQDLNVGRTDGDDVESIKQMTWLKRMWWTNCPASEAEMQAALPNTEVKCRMGTATGHGWREDQHYYDLRDILGMPYYTW